MSKRYVVEIYPEGWSFPAKVIERRIRTHAVDEFKDAVSRFPGASIYLIRREEDRDGAYSESMLDSYRPEHLTLQR